jgi:hypothetical protein
MLERLRKKAQKLVWLEFEGHERAPALKLDFSGEDLEQELSKVPQKLFLGRYSENEIRAKMERNQILPVLRELGFDPLILEVQSDGLIEHRILIHTGEPTYDKILVELRLREGVFKVRESITRANSELLSLLKVDSVTMLWIDWLLLQNPFAKFNPKKPPLPEQKYPGLGLLNQTVPLLGEFAKETRKHAVLDIPEHFHGALFYKKWMKFFNPVMEGKMNAILRDLKKHSLAAITWGLQMECLHNSATGRHESWKPGEQIYPLSEELENYFNSPIYQEMADQSFEENNYRLDFSQLGAKLKFLDADERNTLELIMAEEKSAGN